MNPTSTLPVRELQISTPTDTTIVLTRSFDAPRRLVSEATFTADKMRRWMLPPPGWTLKTCECDPRVGGALEVTWKSEEADPAMTLRGVFTEVVLHERIVHNETMALGSGQTIGSLVEQHELSEDGGVTTMRITCCDHRGIELERGCDNERAPSPLVGPPLLEAVGRQRLHQ